MANEFQYKSGNVKMTLREFEQLPPETLCQLIEGELFMTPSPTTFHQRISMILENALCDFVERTNSGEVFDAPLDVYLSDRDVYQPDIIFVSNENKSIIQERIKGAPDLVMEILSESTGYLDIKTKKKVYEASGIKEYWIVDPMEKSVEIFVLENGRYALNQKVVETGEAKSVLLNGFAIDIGRLFVSV